MKKNLLIGICALSIAAQTSATVITVSNNPNSPGQYTSLQAAADAASNGDTLLIAGSGTSYGGVNNFSKQLHFVGVGYGPNKDFQLKTETGPIQLGVVDANENASGSTIEGILFHGLNLIGTATVPLENITVKRCESSGAYPSSDQMFRMEYVENIFIYNNVLRNCYYYGNFNGSLFNTVYASMLLVDNSTCDNIFVENNLIGAIKGGVKAGGTFIVRNNIFLRDNGNMIWAFLDAANASIANNIIAHVQGVGSASYCSYTNNLAFDNTNTGNNFPSGGTNTSVNNQDGVDPLFVNYTSGQYITNAWNFDFHLQPGSPAIGAGLNGEDLGIYGGNYPWPDGGASGSGWMYRQEPQFPQVNQMTIQNPVVPVNGTLSVTSKGIVND
ncbi:MAG: hypothetical protein H6601_12355 [Flavobacteriales bacterium]|nr:hypothetical protein [Flavobacteriales bacterium]MCB9187522.1 hypothetical protein [Flavobacteriales bacterium]